MQLSAMSAEALSTTALIRDGPDSPGRAQNIMQFKLVARARSLSDAKGRISISVSFR